MIARLTDAAVWLNVFANLGGRLLLSPIEWLPGLVSATLVAFITGVLMLVIFKYTSNQRALKAVRTDIQAQFLGLSLFRDNLQVCLRSQGRILLGACHLMVLSFIPMLVMIIPMGLLVSQLGLWYQSRPLHVGEEAVVTVQLGGRPDTSWPEVSLQPSPAFAVSLGPVRVPSQRTICWNIQAKIAGYHRMVFTIADDAVEKELAVGPGVMRVSTQRPQRKWPDVLWHPAETPFPDVSPVKSVEIQYPAHSAWTFGRNSWLVYWFVMSFVSAVCFRRRLNVNL